jgi:hypothetical protein
MGRQREEDTEINWEDGVDVRWIQSAREVQSGDGATTDMNPRDEPPTVGPWVWNVLAVLVGIVMAIVALGIWGLKWWG